MPVKLDPGETRTFYFLYDAQECFLREDQDIYRIGVHDTYGRTHYAGRKSVERARKACEKDFGPVQKTTAGGLMGLVRGLFYAIVLWTLAWSVVAMSEYGGGPNGSDIGRLVWNVGEISGLITIILGVVIACEWAWRKLSQA